MGIGICQVRICPGAGVRRGGRCPGALPTNVARVSLRRQRQKRGTHTEDRLRRAGPVRGWRKKAVDDDGFEKEFDDEDGVCGEVDVERA